MEANKKKQVIFLSTVALCLAIVSVAYYFVAKSRQYPAPEVVSTEDTVVAELPDDPGAGVVDENGLVSDWNHTYRVMAHAMGGIDNHDYTNSLEAFELNYEEGTRLFEIDLDLTTDGDIVLTHTWEDFREKLTNIGGEGALSTEEFVNAKIYDKYTTLTFMDLLDLMQKYPDFYVIIDSKMFDAEGTRLIYSKMLEDINSVDEKLIKRFIPQAYNPEIIDVLQQEYPFDNIIYTLYSIYDKSSGEEIYQTVKEKGIKTVVMHMDNEWAERVITDVYSYAIMDNNQGQFQIYIHTVNDPEKAVDVVKKYNFFGIYSDFISENQFDEMIK